MARTILMEQFHVSVAMRVGLPGARYSAAARTLRGKQFQRRLWDAIRAVVRKYSSLRQATVTLSV